MIELEAITFDHWNTLVFEGEQNNLRQRRIDKWIARLGEEGHVMTDELLHEMYAATWEQFNVSWSNGDLWSGEDAARFLLQLTGVPVTDEFEAELIEHFVSIGKGVDFELTNGIGDLLATLKAAGLKLGIICDVGFTPSVDLRDHLDRRGLLQFFDGWAFSDDVGVYKPDAKIFEHALEAIGGPAPERVAHVGDLRRTDIAGALAMGMTAIRYSGVFDDPPENGPDATITVDDYADLPARLGL